MKLRAQVPWPGASSMHKGSIEKRGRRGTWSPGLRVEYGFSPHPPKRAEAAASHAGAGDLHLYALNRGVLITPFHNMALMAPTTTEAQVDRHTAVFEEAQGELFE